MFSACMLSMICARISDLIFNSNFCLLNQNTTHVFTIEMGRKWNIFRKSSICEWFNCLFEGDGDRGILVLLINFIFHSKLLFDFHFHFHCPLFEWIKENEFSSKNWGKRKNRSQSCKYFEVAFLQKNRECTWIL